MKLDDVVPLGRSFDEYRLMFHLTETDLDKKIIGMADGPACVNAEMAKLGKHYVSVDPVYVFSAEQIEDRFYQVIDGIMAQIEEGKDEWIWNYQKNVQALKNSRINTMKKFVADFPEGLQQGRYLAGELPQLNFSDKQFDLALCSHFLFLYSAFFSYDFHLASVQEMLRIADEVRIFPLLTLEGKKSDYVSPLLNDLDKLGYAATIEEVDYEFQKGGNELLTVRCRES
jgi:hypothetical protein